MFQGKMKCLTFSYDDGVTQDKRLVKIFNRYGLKATFNINSELFGTPGYLRREHLFAHLARAVADKFGKEGRRRHSRQVYS